jgi:hypothetical protein
MTQQITDISLIGPGNQIIPLQVDPTWTFDDFLEKIKGKWPHFSSRIPKLYFPARTSGTLHAVTSDNFQNIGNRRVLVRFAPAVRPIPVRFGMQVVQFIPNVSPNVSLDSAFAFFQLDENYRLQPSFGCFSCTNTFQFHE